MWCPFCSFTDTKVIDSRLNQDGDTTRRRRVCPRCEGRFTTYERVEEVMPLVIKKDGRREDFRRDKLRLGLEKACQKRAIPSERIDALVADIERRVQSYGLKEIPAKTLGQMMMKELHSLDKVAYIRFASVYQDFNDVPEFVAEIQEPITPNEDPNSLTFSFANAPNSSAPEKEPSA
jgi:transcriptional repressor NrdR